jgi:DOPA 4,5-dioxygenase
MSDLSQSLAEEIKEFHFHVYFFPNNPASRESAHKLRQKIGSLAKQGFFHPIADHASSLCDGPVGPHPIPMFGVWCPKEYFSRMFSWFILNHGEHSVLIHPLTKEELKDHSERASWIGKPVPLNTSKLDSMLAAIPAQYPELGLGYNSTR